MSNEEKSCNYNKNPGTLERLTPIELLCSLFEEHNKQLLETVLEGCSGNLLQTIEYLVCVRHFSRASQQDSLNKFSVSNILTQAVPNTQNNKNIGRINIT